MTSIAYLLISHGSRDPRHQTSLNRLAQLVRERLNPSLVDPWSPQSLPSLASEDRAVGLTVLGSHRLGTSRKASKDGLHEMAVLTAEPPVNGASAPVQLPRERVIVGTAVLDFALLPLHEQICEFGRRLSSAGVERLRLIPLFLLRGKHVMEDIPHEVSLARRQLQGVIDLEIEEPIGSGQNMPRLITSRFSHSPGRGRLLIAHGSRRPKGNRAVDILAKSLGTEVAYWTVDSDIENQTIQLMQQGCSSLTIFPYFLFAGSITDEIAHLTEELAERFPRTKFRLLPPLGATADVANLVVSSFASRTV
ncbi:MAG: CbiX/SirB N-terminal domain-containing protein [Cyanobacteria bacterium P01_C01_bin.118]